LILLRDAMTNTFRTPRDLAAATGFHVMGQIPAIPASGGANVLRYLLDKPQSVAAESVRNLRTSLIVAGDGKLPQVIVSTSALPDEGKSMLAMALAQNLAAMGKSVVLVDGDLRQSAFKTCFGAGTGKGLMAVLAGDVMPEDAVFAAEPYGFDVLAGSTDSAPGVPDVLSSDRFADLVELLAETYDVVLIDAPPVMIVPDARTIGRLATLILFCVRAEFTTRGQVAEGLRLLDGVGTRPPALVLTRVGKSAMQDHEDGTFAARGGAYYRN
jgi:polysaccharide biosynthesis transport protein